MPDITRVLQAIDEGDPHAADQLLPLVYDELRKLAAAKLMQEKPGQTLDATALVHEAYLRLVESSLDGAAGSVPGARSASKGFANRGHFFSAAAEAMRRILIDNARRKARLRHGGGRKRLDLDHLSHPEDDSPEELLALNDALERLAAEEPAVAEVVKLRYFAGLTIPETAASLRISVRTANRHWAYARAWLFQELRESDVAGE